MLPQMMPQQMMQQQMIPQSKINPVVQQQGSQQKLVLPPIPQASK
jgi:hypothetical protein